MSVPLLNDPNLRPIVTVVLLHAEALGTVTATPDITGPGCLFILAGAMRAQQAYQNRRFRV